MQTFELGGFLNDSLAPYKEFARQRNIELTIITDFASRVTLRADTQKIRMLLDTLFKATIDNSPTVINFIIRQLLQFENTILLEFSLEDNGCLCASSKKFSYLRSLVLARSLIEELNGKSELVLEPDGSAMLKFMISCTLKNEEGGKVNRLSHLKGKKVLIVDDNESNQKTIVRLLETEGFECTVASHGRSAIELLEQNDPYDLVLLDTLMPWMDGFETAGYIRKKLKNNVPIIAMFTRDKTWVPLMCREVGINNSIKKPFGANDILRMINETLLGQISAEMTPLMKTA
jgi:CheY-like chemotaxis protein